MPASADRIDPRTLFGFRSPADAVAYLESKRFDTNVWNWFDVQADAHARSFTVAKATRLELLQSIRDALLSARREGFGEAEFVKRLTPELQRLGWWGKQIIVDSAGVAEVAQLGSPARLRLIYRANTMSAYGAARYRQQVGDVASRPFWEYRAVMDAKTRPSHAALNGRVWRFDDPIWQSIYPPNGWNCRCRVRALSQADMDRRGQAVESSAGHLEDIEQEAGVNKRTGEVVTMPGVRWRGVDPVSGKPVSMSPDPGWSSNPGLVPWQPNLDRYDPDIARWYVGEALRGPAFARTVARLQAAVAGARAAGLSADDIRTTLAATAVAGERYPVAVLGPEQQRLLGVNVQTVLVSDDTLLKQTISRDGQGFALADYWRVQRVIEEADFVALDGDQVIIAIAKQESIWVAVTKRTVSGGTLFLTSFRRSMPADVARFRRTTRVVRDELPK